MNTINLYLAPQEGDGLAPQTAWRSVLHPLIHPDAGEWFDEVDHPARRYSLTIVFAEEATHQAIQTDPRVVTILPVVSATAAQIRTHLDTPLVRLRTAVRR